MSDTPLSDLMAQYFDRNDAGSYARFIAAFRQADVGVIASGAPAEAAGEITSTGARPLGVGLTQLQDGRRMVLVFADPPAFVRRFGQRFNAQMSGEAALKTAAANPDCDGVLVNSAVSEAAMIIQREAAISAVAQRPPAADPGQKPWWKIW